MKFIRNGKLYDTDKAKMIGWGLAKDETGYIFGAAELRRTKRGAYILLSDTKGGKCRITLLDTTEAQQWAERHLPVKDVMKHFKIQEG